MELKRLRALQSNVHVQVIASAAWHGIGIALLALGTLLSLPDTWSVSQDKVQVLLILCGYLGLALYVVTAARLSKPALAAHLLIATGLGFGGAYLLLQMLHLPASPTMFMACAGATALWIAIPYLTFRGKAAALAILILTSASFFGVRQWVTSDAPQTVASSIDTALYGVHLDSFIGLIPHPAADGGALESSGAGTILVTGDGKFYWISEEGNQLRAKPLEIPDPMRREAYLRDLAGSEIIPRLRTTDIIFDPLPQRRRLFVGHMKWNRSQRCYTIAISEMPLGLSADGKPRANGRWRQVFDSKPCIANQGPYEDSETGGRLAWTKKGRLLFSLGSLGFDGLHGDTPFAQRNDVDYGKILEIDPDSGQTRIFSLGHRNPQGLVVAADGRIWEAEHGPQGGDEINLIEEGANYGWSYATYGTDYGSKTWPLNSDGHDHGVYHEPALAFLPSMAIAPLIEIQGAEFPHWNGDLLAGSLRTQALIRVRLRDDRAIYSESFSLGHRVRDLSQTPSGRIIVWSDDGTLLELRREDQESAFALYCAGCHQPKFGPLLAPPLDGVMGRRIASVRGFEYSNGLKARRGTWTDAALDTFLRNPSAFAPGTTMRVAKLDAKSRSQVIKELRARGRR